MSKPLNIDPITVISLRPLNDGTFEALLEVSDRDHERLLKDHAPMAYSIPANMTGRVSRASLVDVGRDWIHNWYQVPPKGEA